MHADVLADALRQGFEQTLGLTAPVDGPQSIDEVRERADGEHVDTPFCVSAGGMPVSDIDYGAVVAFNPTKSNDRFIQGN